MSLHIGRYLHARRCNVMHNLCNYGRYVCIVTIKQQYIAVADTTSAICDFGKCTDLSEGPRESLRKFPLSPPGPLAPSGLPASALLLLTRGSLPSLLMHAHTKQTAMTATAEKLTCSAHVIRSSKQDAEVQLKAICCLH
jgi:hypothetical protein